MVSEYARVLRPGGLLLGCREHVVDDYQSSLRDFLDAQVDHQLYGGENAFTLPDYRAAFAHAGFRIVQEIGPYDLPINLHPNTPESLAAQICESARRPDSRPRPAKISSHRLGMWQLRRSNRPGRLYSFVALASIAVVKRCSGASFPSSSSFGAVSRHLSFPGADCHALHGRDVRRLSAHAGERDWRRHRNLAQLAMEHGVWARART